MIGGGAAGGYVEMLMMRRSGFENIQESGLHSLICEEESCWEKSLAFFDSFFLYFTSDWINEWIKKNNVLILNYICKGSLEGVDYYFLLNKFM